MARKTTHREPPALSPRTGKASIQMWIPIALADALERFAARSRPVAKKTAIVTMALEDLLRKAGEIE